MNKFLVMILALLSITACSSSPKTASEYWYGQGERFGANGYQYDNEILATLKESVTFDEQAYGHGYEAGKAEYCDPFKAFEKGIQGVRYNGQCVGQPQEIMIKAEWQRGWDAFIGSDFYKF
ncbi:DUF2799 domain-containing protein [Vibrio sp. B1FLJ16]|uniref:DUF2799 domain-containing protein n=1 Tax=Vibrio sp. B1FLJ16 TaxID=2751178 RepID=UPI0015F72FF8|nr:DUF2799 domain-containing protein [Vibrio sp. B1FLJ16]CAD7801350.1 hypothetical protein ACOMICROBIO_FLGHMIGD_00791 [Vibrio sp. B1FLJ16]CAD7801391.1 hypothetical protein ACOMICROBIO_EPCKBFOG_00797 [Vibrio sp. B1FLJ16]CAE6889907.1 hypothetical protein ACOMICROBIO_FLGHMIGD_00791 [Vibrio sp. B1FLJ16]CAE6890912.1 hypothetical protein ACOMICROBIO_EPCKBFOG_00797 [Vibrio sp. B1FLJ16]